VVQQQRRRDYGFTAGQRAELWSRWKAGESLSDISRALDKAPASIFTIVKKHGGIPPAARSRSRLALTHAEREEISRGLRAGESVRSIATRLSRAPSSISREVARNGGSDEYRAVAAEHRAEQVAVRPKACKLARNTCLRSLVAEKLRDDWSPEQISGWLKAEYPDEVGMRVSHEVIYQTLFIQARGALQQELTKHLRTRRVTRKSKLASTAGQRRGMIKDLVSISERPAEVEDRAVPGHWEGDMISGSKNSHVATLVERSTRFLLLVRLDGKDAATVAAALTNGVKHLPERLKRSLTWDRGPEMAAHTSFTIASDVKVYFCDPQSPWQRGTNENTNGLLRQYFPRGTDLTGFTQDDLDQIARKLNTRPRKTLGYRTPAAMLHQATVASTP